MQFRVMNPHQSFSDTYKRWRDRKSPGRHSDETGRHRGERVTVVKSGNTGLHRDDTVEEPGPRPGQHRGYTVSVRTRSILVGTVPRYITVYRLVFTGANRGSTGTVRSGLKSTILNVNLTTVHVIVYK